MEPERGQNKSLSSDSTQSKITQDGISDDVKVEADKETRENVRIVLDRLGLSKIEVGDCIAADYKLINILVGIQGHQATCPCAYCEWPKKDQFDCSAKERDFEGIR